MSTSDRFAPATTPGTPDPPTSSSAAAAAALPTEHHGLVSLSDYRKRRAEILDAQGRDALHGKGAQQSERSSGAATPVAAVAVAEGGTATEGDGSAGDGATKVAVVAADLKASIGATDKKKKRKGRGMLSFANDEDDVEDDEGRGGGGSGSGSGGGLALTRKKKAKMTTTTTSEEIAATQEQEQQRSHSEPAQPHPSDPPTDDPSSSSSSTRITANSSLNIIPKLQSRAVLRREALERESLRHEFLALQSAVRAAEIAIPFVFHDGTDLPGGTVRVRKGDPVWLFLDRGRKVGATRAAAGAGGGGAGGGGAGGGSRANNRARREWARVSVDDLMLVRGTIIIPPHYEIYYFILNKTIGPKGVRLFDYRADAPLQPADAANTQQQDKKAGEGPTGDPQQQPDTVVARPPPPIETLEGADDEPAFTKVVNRRWYERNKHIYPATLWQEFDPEKDYSNEIKRDLGGNTFFFSR